VSVESKLRRRMLLGGAGAAALLPWLEVFRGGRLANAADPSPIKRFMVFFYPGGVIRNQFWPTGTETDFTMPYILEPLAPYKDKLLIMDGLEQRNMLEGFGHPHTRGMTGLLTGKATIQGPYAFFLGGSTDFAQAASVDHMIAEKISAGKRFTSLELGVLWPTYGTGPSPQNTISFAGPGQPKQPTADPWKAFQRIFMGVGPSMGGDDTAAIRMKRTQLVLDSASAEFNAIMPTLGAEDRKRIEEHLSRLTEIKSGLTAPTGTSPSCVPPTNITAQDTISYVTGGDDSHLTIAQAASNRMPTISRQMIDMAVMSLACDLTRVASIQYTDAASRASFPWLKLNENHHFYQHDGGFQMQPCADIAQFFYGELAYLLKRLSETKEGDQTLLDTTAVLLCSEIGDPPSHDHKRIPFILCGSGGGSFRTGRYVNFGGKPHHSLLVSLLNAYGLPNTMVGDAKFNAGALTGLG
jgi:Protein of unknown function (DUF1552)